MEPIGAHYKPSLINPNKYAKYLDYFKEYIKCGDFKSLRVSLKYVFTHKLPQEGYITNSTMGTFFIRPITNDFQFINPAYERKVKKYIEDHIDEFDVFIDAGACIGEYCVWLAKSFGKKCIAIEPVNFEAVKKNIAMNHLEAMVQVFKCGLGSKKESVYFNVPTGIPSSSYMDKESMQEPNVDIEMIDSLYEKFNIPPSSRILMKMDVEGMESEVVAGAKNFINQFKDLVFIYEHFESDNYKNDKALMKVAEFTFQDIDGVNRLAIKK